ncbi:sensor histidine kinase [Naasia sp. SYSU D00948]|uniref:sensor histidine kinase n=1 Tax=Naasia sp. SYSU D00948 TaxID=2817379 RepID=UPI001B30AE9B|nr:ATP-binding protein [Naasia sp. SYSU D00948]
MSGSPSGTAAPPEVRAPANPITSGQLEVALTRVASIFGVLVALQTVPALLSQIGAMNSAAGLATVVVLFGCLALAGLAAFFRQWTARTFALFAVVYLLALLFWQPIVAGPLPGDDAPWIYYLCNVATGFVAIAARRAWWVAAAYTVAVPGVITWVRTLPSGGGVSIDKAVLDGLYCFFLGSVVLVIAVALRQAAASVDKAQGDALASYSEAVRHNATESERVRVDALVHDSVLTTLLSAARARTAESQALTARMARNAMRHLSEAETSFPTGPADIPLTVLAGRLRLEVAELPAAFDVHMRGLGEGSVPEPVAEAIVAAATQAMVNSVNHAGGGSHVVRSLKVTAVPGGVCVRVHDTGHGFDPQSIPVERLGVRTSIIRRMEDVGGTATVTSRPGHGTTVDLEWTAPEGADAAGPGEWTA